MKWSLKFLALISIVLHATTYTADTSDYYMNPAILNEVCTPHYEELLTKKYTLLKENNIDLAEWFERVDKAKKQVAHKKAHDGVRYEGVSTKICTLVTACFAHCDVEEKFNIVGDTNRLTAACNPFTIFVNPSAIKRYGLTAFMGSLFHEAGHIYFDHGVEYLALKKINNNEALCEQFMALQEQEADIFALNVCPTQRHILARGKFWAQCHKEKKGYHSSDDVHQSALERAEIACTILEAYSAHASLEERLKLIDSLRN